MNAFDIGIVIVNYNVRHFLHQCLHSIYSSNLQGLKIEVIVVDNASVDGSVASVKQNFPQVRLIANKENLGFSKANNLAIDQLDAKYVLLLNPDTVLEEDTLNTCFTYMESKPKVGAVGVRMVDGGGKFLPESKRGLPTLWNSFCKLFFISDLFPKSKFFGGYNLGYLSEFEEHNVEVLSGAFMFLRKETLEKVGLLDERFFMYAEDIDLSFRITKAGYSNEYLPTTSIIHYKGESTKKGSLNYVSTFYGAMILYVQKHYGAYSFLAFFIKIAVWIRAGISILGRIVSQLLHPIIDILVIFTVLLEMTKFWASYYYHDNNYYQNSPQAKLLILYTILWVSANWICGHYNSTKKFWTTLQGVCIGTLGILVIYALLPIEYRPSRFIILSGSLFVYIILLTTQLVSRISRSTQNNIRKQEKIIAIVANEESGYKLKNTVLSHYRVKSNNIYFISPKTNNITSLYANSIDNIEVVVSDLQISEIIFNNGDLSIKDIIKIMSRVGANVTYKIADDDTLQIIGNNNRNTQGHLYDLTASYNLSQPNALRQKRMVDIFVCGLIFLFYPLVWLVNLGKKQLFTNLISVLHGHKTWLGFGGEKYEKNQLPKIKPCILPVHLLPKYYIYNKNYIEESNIAYCQSFSLVKEFLLILKNVDKLGKIDYRK